MHFYIFFQTGGNLCGTLGPKKKKIKMKTTDTGESPECSAGALAVCRPLHSSSAPPRLLDSLCVQQELERARHRFHLYSRPSSRAPLKLLLLHGDRSCPKTPLGSLLLMLKCVDVQMYDFKCMHLQSAHFLGCTVSFYLCLYVVCLFGLNDRNHDSSLT